MTSLISSLRLRASTDRGRNRLSPLIGQALNWSLTTGVQNGGSIERRASPASAQAMAETLDTEILIPERAIKPPIIRNAHSWPRALR